MSYQRHTSKAILKVSIASAFVAIPGLEDFTPPESAPLTAESTLLSDDDVGKTGIGRRAVSDGKITLAYDPQNSVHAALRAANDSLDPADNEMDFEIHYPSSTGLVEAFTGIVKFVARNMDKKQVGKRDITFEINGALTQTVS